MKRLLMRLTPGVLAVLLVTLTGCSSTVNTGSPSPTSSPTSTATPTPAPSSSASLTPAPSQKPAVTPTQAAPLNGNVSPAQAKTWIEGRAAEVLQALKAQDMKKLAGYVHPELGVRFSPYTNVNKKTDMVIKADQLEKTFTDSAKRTWGAYDGSGEPISLSFAQYYAKFVYDHDYVKPEKTSYNEPIGKGNTVNNTREAYPKAILVECYFSGFDPKLEGHDWASLKLVFEHTGTGWYLVGLVHDQWTI
ncbi:hypothetical protein [Paenibacillus sp. HJGM_3]|uniref:hypothetical protein n=1 Tax=Paenibacillus sp. HJGM_3 TaxID=3379816 RepID=UPI0038598019